MHILYSYIWPTLILYNLMLMSITKRYLHPRWTKRGMNLFGAPSDTPDIDDAERAFRVFASSEKNRMVFPLRYAMIPLTLIPAWYFFAFNNLRGILLSTLVVSTVFFYTYFMGLSDFLYCKVPSGANWAMLGISFVFLLFYAFRYREYGVLWEFGMALVTLTVIALTVSLLTRRGSFGAGDVRFLISLSALAPWFGWSVIVLGILAGSILELFVRPILRRLGDPSSKASPFLPALIIGTLLAIIIFHSSGQSCKDLAGFIASC